MNRQVGKQKSESQDKKVKIFQWVVGSHMGKGSEGYLLLTRSKYEFSFSSNLFYSL